MFTKITLLLFTVAIRRKHTKRAALVGLWSWCMVSTVFVEAQAKETSHTESFAVINIPIPWDTLSSTYSFTQLTTSTNPPAIGTPHTTKTPPEVEDITATQQLPTIKCFPEAEGMYFTAPDALHQNIEDVLMDLSIILGLIILAAVLCIGTIISAIVWWIWRKGQSSLERIVDTWRICNRGHTIKRST
ncbi:hypothetical protein BCR34DRAFT_574885 [Clohesyomyces aquaticus]|uniref:Uncharacterized protein n=1 Tax=Clohesyomyces aquaticus TaxID=1231657 RepID=A0A1Y1YTY5_9PLEO|nr:hypothetical protein BCR34DRAFT_574885 [Clohesyomyces aquaticus]